MPEIQISANLIEWPDRCACCMGEAEVKIAAVAARSSGVRVVRRDERSWNVPYCRRCAKHQNLADEADRLADEPDVSKRPWKQALRERQSVLVAAGLIAGGLLTCSCCVLQAGVSNGELADVNAGWAFGIFGCSLLIGAAACFRWIHLDRIAKRARLDWEDAMEVAQRERDDAWEAAQKAMRRKCVCLHPAVIYHGWRGTVHTFHFESGEYAAMFRDYNRGKVL